MLCFIRKAYPFCVWRQLDNVNCSESLNVSPLICPFLYERVIKEYELQRSNSIHKLDLIDVVDMLKCNKSNALVANMLWDKQHLHDWSRTIYTVNQDDEGRGSK